MLSDNILLSIRKLVKNVLIKIFFTSFARSKNKAFSRLKCLKNAFFQRFLGKLEAGLEPATY